MTLKSEHNRIEADFQQAAGLLRHDLIWSEDFDAIRLDLADYLERVSTLGVANRPSLVILVNDSPATENDLSVS